MNWLAADRCVVVLHPDGYRRVKNVIHNPHNAPVR